MINPNELRIGNIVWETSMANPSTDDMDEIVVGAVNGVYNTIYDDQDNIYSKEYIYPIPLTPEWLERLGFVLVNDNWTAFVGVVTPVALYRKRRKYIDFDIAVNKTANTINRLYKVNNDEYGFLDGPTIESVHQLQNLYFALTREELTIKEKV
jgi:hypothetical protein